MASVRLSNRTVESARYRGTGRAPCIIWDSRLIGFGLRIHPTGRQSFVLRYRTRDRRQRWETLGTPGVVTVEQARRRAQKLLAAVLDGADPRAARRQARTFQELAEAFLEQHSIPRKRSARNDVQRVRDYLVPAWGSRSATSLKRADVAELHRSLEPRGIYVANRVLALVSGIFSWGERVGLLPEGQPNPARGVPHFREQSRSRWLSPEELRLFMKAIEREPSVYLRAFFRLLLLTGCRKDELRGLRWADVDFGLETLRISQTKAGRPHLLPLSGAALEIFRSIPREERNPHVFPGREPGSSLVNVERAWRRMRGEAGILDVRIHDLRRTAGSLMAQAGASLPVIGAVLNHSTPSTTQIYAHLADANERDALEHLADVVVEAGGLEPKAESLSSEDGKR